MRKKIQRRQYERDIETSEREREIKNERKRVREREIGKDLLGEEILERGKEVSNVWE